MPTCNVLEVPWGAFVTGYGYLVSDAFNYCTGNVVIEFVNDQGVITRHSFSPFVLLKYEIE